jgi:hypothetical protein
MEELEGGFMIPSEERIKSGGNRLRLNPYRVALRLMLNRLSWDLSITSWRQRRRLESLHNKYQGQKAIILCNGPSLRDVDFTALDGIYTFGLNKINLMFRESDFRPSCIVAVNPFVIEQNAAFYAAADLPLFLDRYAVKCGIKDRGQSVFLDSCDFPYFSRDCSLSVFQGFTVTYVALQLAYHMGFTRVALVGCDHNYGNSSGLPNSITQNPSTNAAHFCGDYFASGQPWQLPDLKASELYYDVARRCFEDEGRKVVNASSSTKLDIFALQRLEDFIRGQ